MKKHKINGAVRKILLPYNKKVWLLCGMALVNAVLQVVFALLSRNVVDSALAGGEELTVWSILLLTVVAAIAALYALQNWIAGSTTDRCTARLRYAILESTVYRNDTDLREFHSGQLLSRSMEDVHTVCDGHVTLLPFAVGQAARLVASFAAVFALYPPLALLVALAAVLLALVISVIRPVLKRHHAKVRKQDEKAMAQLQEDLQQLELIRSMGVQKPILDRFSHRLDRVLETKDKRRRWTMGYSTMITTAAQVATAVTLLWGAGLTAQKVLSYGTLTAMLQLLNLLRNPVVSLSGILGRITGVEVASQRIEGLLQTPEKTEPVQIHDVKAVVFENVTFAYPGDTQPVLKDFSASFPLNGWVCLTGASGLGKTTMFKLMLGLYAPQSGRVYLQSAEGELLCGPQTRHIFAYVPQDYVLLSGTVLENLLLVAPDANKQQRQEALRLADADFVFDLPAGEKTAVKENNAGLSKGQLQRLAIARALLTQRPVLLLDECTSALDGQTEQTVLANLQSTGKSALLVSHHPESLNGKVHMFPLDRD